MIVLKDLLPNQAQTLIKIWGIRWIQQWSFVWLNITSLKFKSQAYAWMRRSFAAAASPVQYRVIPAQNRTGSCGQCTNILKVDTFLFFTFLDFTAIIRIEMSREDVHTSVERNGIAEGYPDCYTFRHSVC